MAGPYFTGSGDSGETGVLGGRVRKDSRLMDAIGNIDELNSCIGVAAQHVKQEGLKGWLQAIQNDLFKLGAYIASLQNGASAKAGISSDDIEGLEAHISRMSEALPELRQFVIPSGSEGASYLHLTRAVARRAERSIVSLTGEYAVEKKAIAYANRLSSFLFVAALYENHAAGKSELNPTY